VTDAIPEAVLASAVTGINLVPGALRRQLSPGDTLLVFLRQLGCPFCRETIGDLRDCVAADPGYPKVLFFVQAGPVETRALLRGLWPSAHAVSDPERRFYAAFGIERGSLWRTLGPEVWRARSRAKRKGYASGERQGDVWMMPGTFLVRDERIVWSHGYRHAADHPEFARIPELASAGT
jgi:hypothetical protein